MSQIDDYKAVMVISESLSRGPAANRAAVLATGLAAHVPGMIGQNLFTKDGTELLGFTRIPIPVLSTKPETSFSQLMKNSEELGCKVIVFLARAQGMRSYEDYKNSISQTNDFDLDIDAVAIYGDKKSINSLTGNLPSLR